MSPNKLMQGFTLLEVLVASVILISSIAAISLAYRGALIASERADKNIQVSGVMPVIIAKVSDDLKTQDTGQQNLSGEGESWGVKFNWAAELTQFKSAPERFDPDEESFVVDEPRFRLWQVQLTVNNSGMNKSYSYKEMSWLSAK